MPSISFENARQQVTDSVQWLNDVSKFIANPAAEPPPTDFSATQKLAFEIDKLELESIMKQSRVVGILSMEPENSTLSFVLVGVDEAGKPVAATLPKETFPRLNFISELSTVLDTYLTP